MVPTQAEVKLVQLKNCFVNVPQSIVTILDNANAVVQNVVVELQYRDTSPNAVASRKTDGIATRSVFTGWTGMASTAKLVPLVEKTGKRAKENVGMVEIDATFGRMLGLVEGQKVGILLHLDPPLAHTVHIEPLTPADWEIIELHASFLESNLLFQVRALPNPSFAASPSAQAQKTHPLTIHLSPTSTANVIISSLTPPQSASTPFVKIAPDGEVIVAPKTRPRLSQNDRTTSRSVASTGRRSTGMRSSTTRQRSNREASGPSAVYLRGVDRSVCSNLFDEDELANDCEKLAVWVDRDCLTNKLPRGTEYVSVSIIRPAGIEPPVDPQQLQRIRDAESSDSGKPSAKIVAKLLEWDDAPDSLHAALSPTLALALNAQALVGGLVRIEAAPVRLTRGDLDVLRFYPFRKGEKDNDGLRIGGQAVAAHEAVRQIVRDLRGDRDDQGDGLLFGPLTDGLVLIKDSANGLKGPYEGCIVRFGPRPVDDTGSSKSLIRWCIGSEIEANTQVQQEISNPFAIFKPSTINADSFPTQIPSLTGIDDLINQLISHLSHSSSVLLTGGLGAGKSSLAQLIGHRLRSGSLFHISYFPCRTLLTDETRISTIKDALTRLFMTASWGTKLGGKSLVIIDDLDRLCPVETELQTSDNDHSRQTSELVCSIVRQYCGVNSGIVILASAQSKEALNTLIIGGHVVREIVPMKVPNKDGRRQILHALTGHSSSLKSRVNGITAHARPESQDSEGDETAWMDGSPAPSEQDSAIEKFHIDRELDFLDLAGQTDGYMPGDLVLLISRAKNEALIRSVEASTAQTDDFSIILTKADFQSAINGFTPASLRNVTLQTSKTTFDSIGGLREVRKVLLETLQYPTTYAPIFAQCPLRLRSGLLLYGYPGCGKTLLASAVAGECGLNFISVKGPEILNKYIGASEKSVRDLFERAESARPCVLFFDEFDSIAPKRGHDSTGVTDRVVNQLLTQMDGAEGLSGVYVLAATSRPDLIDPALLRPGRLDKSLLCDMPALEDRLDILQTLSKKLSIAPAITNGSIPQRSLSEVSERTAGFSGADLQAVIYNAHLEAIHDVLGDHTANHKLNGSNKGSHEKSGHSSKNDILQFRFGREETSNSAPSAVSRAKEAAEYAAIIAKLDAIKLAKRKERHARRGITGKSATNGVNGATGKDHTKQEVIIEWRHIEASLATTRSSVAADEKRKLERIYREFTVGRNGEMPDGQGPTEVGGRSSLM